MTPGVPSMDKQQRKIQYQKLNESDTGKELWSGKIDEFFKEINVWGDMAIVEK